MTNDQDIKKIREMMEFLIKDKISEKIKKLTPDSRKVFELTGEKGQKDMVRMTGFSAGKISGIWQELEKEGLLIREGAKYRKVI